MFMYAGMTVNERLYVSGRLEEFDQLVKQKDVNGVIKVLKEIELSDASIPPILQALGLIEDSKMDG